MKFEKTISLLKGVLDYESFKDMDMVIEAVIENVSLKQQIFSDLEKYCPPHCILASNTSTIDLNLIGERTKSQDRIAGAHFFRFADLVGFGVAIATGTQFIDNFPERTYKSMLISLMQEDKRAGETTRKGFYVYDDKRRANPDPELKKYIEKSMSISGVAIDPKLVKLPEKDIVEMIFFPMVNEARRVLAEGIAVKAADLDIAAVFGMGFPPYRGGIMFWADSLGSNYIYSRLEEWSNSYRKFFKPCAYLAERASKGAPLSFPVEHAKSRL